MADFRDSTKVMQATLALVKFWLVLNGLYIWEFITTLDYEWSVIRRRRPYRWTIWIYSLARTAGLIGILLGLVGIEVESQLNCQLLISSTLILSYLSTAATSLLIVLRIIAVWDRNKVVAATAYSIWGINVAFLIQAVVRLRTTWIPERKGCMVINSETGMPTLISIVVTDVVLLLIVLVGLLRLCRYGGGKFGLTHFLWKQGVIWLLIAAAAEVPPVVFIILNLNDALNLMFQSSSLVTMTIAATRMHRSLVDFATAPPNLEYEDPLSGPPTAPKTNLTRASSPYNPMAVAVHEVFEQHPTPQTSDHGSCISTDEQVHEKPDKMSRGDDVERAM